MAEARAAGEETVDIVYEAPTGIAAAVERLRALQAEYRLFVVGRGRDSAVRTDGDDGADRVERLARGVGAEGGGTGLGERRRDAVERDHSVDRGDVGQRELREPHVLQVDGLTGLRGAGDVDPLDIDARPFRQKFASVVFSAPSWPVKLMLPP